MAYFLGRDLNLAITTEKPNLAVYVDEGLATDTLVPIINDFQHGATVEPYVAGHKTKLFAGPMAVDSNTGKDIPLPDDFEGDYQPTSIRDRCDRITILKDPITNKKWTSKDTGGKYRYTNDYFNY